VRPSDLNDDANWTGGFYELALELGPKDDARLEQALLAVWRDACVSGCFVPEYRAGAAGLPRRLVGHSAVELSLNSLARYGRLDGVVRLPRGADVVCAAVAMRDDLADWLSLCLPTGALARTDARIGAYPFGPNGGRKSLAWRRAIDDWLAGVAVGLFPEIPFRLGLIGCEASGEVRAEQLATVAGPVHLGYLLPAIGGLRYQEATG
jgi:hypothetical protein